VVWLVVSEFAMPGMTEGELASTIIAQWPEIPLLLVSDRPPAGWDGPFLARPFSPEALATAVKDLLPPAERPIGGRHA
jgi:hypothetical protein